MRLILSTANLKEKIVVTIKSVNNQSGRPDRAGHCPTSPKLLST